MWTSALFWLFLAGVWLLACTCVFALILRPDVSRGQPAVDAARLAEVGQARQLRLTPQSPPRIQREVNYAQGREAAWWQKCIETHLATEALKP